MKKVFPTKHKNVSLILDKGLLLVITFFQTILKTELIPAKCSGVEFLPCVSLQFMFSCDANF